MQNEQCGRHEHCVVARVRLLTQSVCLQVFVEHVFSSCVRCLATDAESDVVWAGDEAGRLAVLRCAPLQLTASAAGGKHGSRHTSAIVGGSSSGK
jgi:hypothetical protein